MRASGAYHGWIDDVWERYRRAKGLHTDPRSQGLLIQPLIENAVHHGVLQRKGGVTVLVCFDVDGDRLRCRVTDDGPGVDPHKSPRPGSIGIAAVERRLALEYGTDASFCLFSSDGETTASVELPLTLRAAIA